MEIQKLTGSLGAVVEDVVLETIDDATFERPPQGDLPKPVEFEGDWQLP